MKQIQKRRGTNVKKIIRLFAVLCVVIAFVGGAGAYYVYHQLQPIHTETEKKVKQVTIPKGSSVMQIADLLEQQGIIKNAGLFSLYAKWQGLAGELKAGDYQLHTAESVQEILQRMSKGDVYADSIRITIPEGWNVEQIAAFVEQKGLGKKDVFLREINQGAFPEYPFVASIPKQQGRKHRLEGYLFPETYEVPKGATEREIISRMLAQFQKEMKPEWIDTLKKRKMSVDDAVTLASIVEREVVVDKERPVVAGVYYNRLRDDWLLQADATVQYVLGKQRDRITYADLKIDNPYNTYKHPGLPPGPIANPGRESLQAVVQPATHDYYFYVTKKDGTQEHYFSKTFAEHKEKNEQSQKN